MAKKNGQKRSYNSYLRVTFISDHSLFGEIFEQKKNTLSHSFCIIIIPSVLLLFLPDYCHSLRISVIPSELLSFLLNYCHSFQIIVIPSKLLLFQILFILNSSGTLPSPKGEKNGHQRWPYMRVLPNSCTLH